MLAPQDPLDEAADAVIDADAADGACRPRADARPEALPRRPPGRRSGAPPVHWSDLSISPRMQ